MAKTKKPAPRAKSAPRTKAPAPTAPHAKAPAAPAVSPAPAKHSHFDERRPDAAPTLVATHARRLAKQVRVDAAELARAKVTPVDANRLDLLADALDTAQEAWLILKDQRDPGGLADTRDPLREGRDQLFAALRTFARRNPDTQAALDRIAGVEGDDDLVSDATRLLALARKHHADLDGTDVTADRLAQIRAALTAFSAARGGARPAAPAPGEGSPRPATAQAEDEATRAARRARNRAYWTLAELDRDVVERGRYAFRKDEAKAARYRAYRGSNGASAGTEETPATPVTK
jgi:hypothetical protein